MDRSFADSPAFAGAIYFAALVIILSNFLDLGANIWPFRPGTPSWRYGAIGLTGGFLLTPLLGIVLAMVYAGARQDRVGMLAFTIPSLVLGGIILLLVPFFILDSLQVRAVVTEEMRGPFQFGIAKALFKLVTAGSAMLWCGVVGLRWIRRHRAAHGDTGGRRGGGEGLVVGS